MNIDIEYKDIVFNIEFDYQPYEARYIFSGFGVLFALACIGVMFGGSPTSDIIMSSIVFTLIVCSWIVFVIRWFKRRIKEDKSKL